MKKQNLFHWSALAPFVLGALLAMGVSAFAQSKASGVRLEPLSGASVDSRIDKILSPVNGNDDSVRLSKARRQHNINLLNEISRSK